MCDNYFGVIKLVIKFAILFPPLCECKNAFPDTVMTCSSLVFIQNYLRCIIDWTKYFCFTVNLV